MEAHEQEGCQGSAVAVVDSLDLRRACLTALLELWAHPLGIGLRPIDGDVPTQFVPSRMFILNLGSRSITDPVHFQWIQGVRERSPQAPFVILSDRDDREEMLSAFGSGASGFLPTSINPDVAFHALTFILHGGSFFPPSALLSDSCDKGKGAGARRDPVPGQKTMI